jgi:hypothetical protein
MTVVQHRAELGTICGILGYWYSRALHFTIAAYPTRTAHFSPTATIQNSHGPFIRGVPGLPVTRVE